MGIAEWRMVASSPAELARCLHAFNLENDESCAEYAPVLTNFETFLTPDMVSLGACEALDQFAQPRSPDCGLLGPAAVRQREFGRLIQLQTAPDRQAEMAMLGISNDIAIDIEAEIGSEIAARALKFRRVRTDSGDGSAKAARSSFQDDKPFCSYCAIEGGVKIVRAFRKTGSSPT